MLYDPGTAGARCHPGLCTPAPTEGDHTHAGHLWEAVIQRAEGYDAEATAQADPSHTNAEAVFVDGSHLWWNAALQVWETGPASTQGERGETGASAHCFRRGPCVATSLGDGASSRALAPEEGIYGPRRCAT
jgi:hypothetical protein